MVVAQWLNTGGTSQVSWVLFPATASFSLSSLYLKNPVSAGSQVLMCENENEGVHMHYDLIIAKHLILV